MRTTRASGAIAVLALLLAAPAIAAEEDAQVWTSVQTSRAVSDRIVLTLDTQARFNNDAGRLGQAVFRPSVGYRLSPTTTASLGVAGFRNSALGQAPAYEHRVWQQLTYRVAGDGRGLTVNGRTRLEQRQVENRDGTGWRLRQQVRVTAPLQDGLRGVVWTEGFFGLNETGWGQRDGLLAWRNFVGVTIPVSKTATFEPGYLNQRIYRPGRDFVGHIASMTLTLQY